MATDMTREARSERRALIGAASNYAGKLFWIATWLFLTPFILSRLGPTDYGLWVLMGSVVAYGALLDFGIGNTLVKYVAEHHARNDTGRIRELIATSLWLYSALGAAAFALCLAVAPLVPDLIDVPPAERAKTVWIIVLTGLAVGVSTPCVTAIAVLRGLQRYDVVNLLESAGTLLFAAAVVGVLLSGGGVLGLMASITVVTLVMQAVSLWCLHRVAPQIRVGWRGASRVLARQIVAFSTPLFVSQAAAHLKGKTDEFVIAGFLLLRAVTPYSITRKLSEVGQLLTEQFVKVLLPLASELHADNDQARLRGLYLMSSRLSLAVFLPIACALVVLAPAVLTLWVGAEYAQYAYLVTILTAASLVETSQWPANFILQGMGRHRPLAVYAACGGIANLVLSIALVGRLGLAGVAIGTLIPVIFECFAATLPYTMRTLGVRASEVLRQVFLPTLLPAIPALIVMEALRRAVDVSSVTSVALVAGAGCALYAVEYLCLGASRIEREVGRRLLSGAFRLARARLGRL